MTSKAELASRQRQTTLLIIASAFLFWQLPLIEFIGDGELTFGTLDIISGIGMLAWILGLWRFVSLGRLIEQEADPAMKAELDDELVRLNRSRAMVAGYITALVSSGLMIGLNLVVAISGMDVARITMVACVVVPVFVFVSLERKHG